jgi:hypothetical protein
LFQANGASVIATDGEGTPVVSSHQLGGGTVVFTSDNSLEGTRRAVEAFLILRSVAATRVSPLRPQRPVFELDRAEGGRIFTLLAVRPEGKDKTPENGPWIDTPERYTVNAGTKQVTLSLGSYGVALFSVRSDDAVDAIEGQGEFNEDGFPLLESEPHVMAMSLDGKPLRSAEALALFPIGAGNISVAAAPGCDVVEVGEIVEGRFRPLETIDGRYEKGRISFQIDETQSRHVLLIRSRTNRELARKLMDQVVQ